MVGGGRLWEVVMVYTDCMRLRPVSQGASGKQAALFHTRLPTPGQLSK